MSKQITSWSFSRYYDYRTCPKKSFFKVIQRLQEPGNKAMDRGNAIHKLAERYVKGEIRTMPTELSRFITLFKELKGLYKKKIGGVVCEDSWAFRKDWTQTRYDDWTGCHVRIKVDCASNVGLDLLTIYDWKTGKYRPEKHADYLEQLELYAVGGFHQHKHVKAIQPELVYLDQGIMYPEGDDGKLYQRKELPALQKKWEKRVLPMLNDTVFAPRPSHECQWCHFRKSNGGPCQY